MDWLKKRFLTLALAAIVTFCATQGTQYLLKHPTVTVGGMTITIPPEVIAAGTNQIAIWEAKLKDAIENMNKQ